MKIREVPQVFIIESLRFNDEEKGFFEGRILSDILRLNGKKSKYYYIRTRAELEKVVDIFRKTTYRYLHISCHGNRGAMFTTLDEIPFSELGSILNSCLRDRRLFFSACELVNKKLAREILPKSGAFSIIGPSSSVRFSDAAILWASFYHLMFKSNEQAMKRKDLLRNLKKLTRLFGVTLNYYSKSRSDQRG